jgi:hypothetical protein
MLDFVRCNSSDQSTSLFFGVNLHNRRWLVTPICKPAIEPTQVVVHYGNPSKVKKRRLSISKISVKSVWNKNFGKKATSVALRHCAHKRPMSRYALNIRNA